MATLTEQLLTRLEVEMAPEIRTLVGHKFPDDDVWLSFWIAKKFVKKAAKAEMVFVDAGTCLEGTEDDLTVLHFDTGGGVYDQHGKSLERTCSAKILAESLGVDQDPGLVELLEMVTAVDNAEKLPPTSLHFAIEGYPRIFNSGSIDWQKVQERVFELFDIVYGQEANKGKARADLPKFAKWRELPNGLRVCSIFGQPQLREAAFEQGAAVVIWTTRPKKGKHWVGIQKNNRDPRYTELKLTEVVAWLRKGEAGIRGIDVEGQDLGYIGRDEPVSNWFLHDSLNLILNGSRTWELTEDEFTRLDPFQIEARTCYILGKEVI